MNISHFINPPEEAVVNSGDDLLQQIAKTFSKAHKLAEEDEEQQVPQPISTTAALQAVNLLVQFKVQEGGADLAALERVRRRVTEVRLQRAGNGAQGTLEAFFQTDSQ